MRSEASHRSEMVSQLLFGEICEVMEERQDWKKIRSAFDNYEGWVQLAHITEFTQTNSENNRYLSSWINRVILNGAPAYIPMGACIPGLENGEVVWKKTTVQYDGELVGVQKPTGDAILDRAKELLNTGYLWGGRSVFGIDCSGFCQIVFRFFGINLPRDAYLQAGVGEDIGFLQEAKPGDLAFFDNAEGRIIHVGILMNDHQVIHAASKVRIDNIDNLGIVNTETGQRTHKLRLIKRYF